MQTKVVKAGNADAPVTIAVEGRADPQAVVDALILRHGTNLPNWADWPDKLREAGLDPADVTIGMIRKAEVNFRKSLRTALDKPPREEIVWERPVKEETAVSVWHSWWTSCRRFRVTRTATKLSEGESGYHVSFVKGTQHPNGEAAVAKAEKWHRTLEGAFVAAEELYCKQLETIHVKSNKKQRLNEAAKEGLASFPSENQNQGEEEAMHITEELARRTLEAAGLQGATDPELFSTNKMLKRFNQLPDVEGLQEPSGGEELEAWKRAVSKLAKGGEFTFDLKVKEVPSGKGASNGKAPAGTKAGKKKGKEDATPKAAKVRKERNPNDPKRAERDKDAFGSYVNSAEAKVNAVLTKDPKSFGEIVKETGLSRGQVRYKHLERLVKEKHVVKTKEGWALKK
jgi:hypothetical protein